jgi:hypothetical protein
LFASGTVFTSPWGIRLQAITAVFIKQLIAEHATCVFRRKPPVIPIESHHLFQRKASSDRSEATLELKSFPKWMASVK